MEQPEKHAAIPYRQTACISNSKISSRTTIFHFFSGSWCNETCTLMLRPASSKWWRNRPPPEPRDRANSQFYLQKDTWTIQNLTIGITPLDPDTWILDLDPDSTTTLCVGMVVCVCDSECGLYLGMKQGHRFLPSTRIVLVQ